MTPLVFLPGASGRAAFWAKVAERLEDLGPCHLFGYPGFSGLPADPSIHSLADLTEWVLARLPTGPSHVVAQSMGGVLAARLAIEYPERVGRLVLAATSGGVDVAQLGGADWRQDYRASLPGVPAWFTDDRTDLTERLASIEAPTLLLWSDVDPVSPLAVSELLAARLKRARRVVLSGGSHAFAEERPEEVAAAIRQHLSPERP